MRKKHAALGLVLVLLVTVLCGCAQRTEPAVPAAKVEPASVPVAEPVTLVVAGSWPDCRALELTAQAFSNQYPECTVVYEYVQDYYTSLEKRMTGAEPVDLFFTTNIQADSPMLPYAADLYAAGLKLSDTFDGLLQNFAFRGAEGDPAKLYAVPLGAEMRGLYVNVTLLKSLGLEIPTNQEALLAACQTLKEHGYIPFHGNPGDFAQTLLYPWICSLVANAEDPQAAYQRVDAREPGLSQFFREPYEFLYTLVENGYYDYKRAQTELGLFTDTTDDAYCRDFLSIRKEGENWTKADDVGQVAFLPSPMSMGGTMAKTKDDYHSGIEYAFVLAPVGKEGGYAYLSPAHGIAASNRSAHLDWAVKFLDFLFEPENNKTFAEAFNVIPNTREAFAYIRTLFDLPDNHISHLGQVTFSYGFYEVVRPSLVDLSKANNPKYMQDDGKGNLSLYPLEAYLEELERGFQEK